MTIACCLYNLLPVPKGETNLPVAGKNIGRCVPGAENMRRDAEGPRMQCENECALRGQRCAHPQPMAVSSHKRLAAELVFWHGQETSES